MHIKQKDLLVQMLESAKASDSDFDSTVTYEVDMDEVNGTKIIIIETLIEGLETFIFFVHIAQLINTTMTVFSAMEELLVYGIDVICNEENKPIALQYTIF